MYTRITSRVIPSRTLHTENEWEISPDKSSVLISGSIDKDGNYCVGPVGSSRHALHVYRNPALGLAPVQIITPDDAQVELNKPSKSKLKDIQELDWHYKIFVVRIAFPD